MLKVVLWILAILLLVGIAMLNPLIAAGIVIAGLLIQLFLKKWVNREKEKWTIGYESCEPVIYKANDI